MSAGAKCQHCQHYKKCTPQLLRRFHYYYLIKLQFFRRVTTFADMFISNLTASCIDVGQLSIICLQIKTGAVFEQIDEANLESVRDLRSSGTDTLMEGADTFYRNVMCRDVLMQSVRICVAYCVDRL